MAGLDTLEYLVEIAHAENISCELKDRERLQIVGFGIAFAVLLSKSHCRKFLIPDYAVLRRKKSVVADTLGFGCQTTMQAAGSNILSIIGIEQVWPSSIR